MILAIDPGETTGYVVYDPDAMRVEARGLFRGHDQVMLMPARCVVTVVVLERLVPHGASYPQVVTSAYVGGRLTERTDGQVPTHELERQRVRNVLQEATHGAIKVKDDKTVWAALKLLHGGGPKGIGCHKHHLFPLTFEIGGQLANGGGFADSVHSNNHND